MSRDIIPKLAERMKEGADGHDVQGWVESYLWNIEDSDPEEFNELRSAHFDEEDDDEDDIYEVIAESMLDDADGEDQIGYIEDYLYSLSDKRFEEVKKDFGF